MNYPTVKQPKNVKMKLRKNQLTSIYWMNESESKRSFKVGDTFIESNVRILGDKPGAGKTLTVASFLAQRKNDNWNPQEEHIVKVPTYNDGLGLFTMHREYKYKRIDCDLIVCSPNLIRQWEKELDKTDLIYYTVDGKDAFNFNPNRYDVVLLCSTFYNEYIDFVKLKDEKVWRRFIYDEAADTKIVGMRHVMAGFYWFITATYQRLKYVRGINSGRRQHMISKIFYNIYDDVLERLVVKCPDEYVDQCISPPPYETINHKCKSPHILNALGGLISDDVKNMISAGDVKGAMDNLGCKECDNILDVVRKKKMDEIKEAEHKVEIYSKNENKSDLCDNWKIRLEKHKKELSDMEERVKYMLDKECGICYEELKETAMLPCCLYIMCGTCVTTLISNSGKLNCPNCRASNIDPKKVFHLKSDKKVEEKGKDVSRDEERELKLKIDTLVDVINEYEDGKFVLFSSFDETFNVLRNVFKSNNISFKEIKGRGTTREKNIELFRKGKVKVLFLNSKFNGAGINLDFATDVVLYSTSDEFVEKQNIGRVGRPPRTETFRVHRFLEE